MNTADVLVVGAGPSGLAAAVTLASEGRSVTLFERNPLVGGQLATTTMVENYLPFPDGISGEQFSFDAEEQCRKFGVQIEYNTSVVALIPTGTQTYTLVTCNGCFHGRAVLLALGLAHKPLNVPGADHPRIHLGMNKYALSNVAGKRLALIGGGNSVGQAACYYLSQGAHVTIISRSPLEEKMSAYLVKRIAPVAEVVLDAVTEFNRLNDDICIQTTHPNVFIHADCVHILIGQYPPTAWLGKQVRLDGGYIVVDEQGRTNCPGVFAVGDVTLGAVRRAMCAVGRGVEVVPAIHQYLGKNFECSFDK